MRKIIHFATVLGLFLAGPAIAAADGDATLRRTLPGAYSDDAASVNPRSDIVLGDDGSFTYHTIFGTFLGQAAGHWAVSGGRVMFHSQPQPDRTFVLSPRAGTAPAGQVTVTVVGKEAIDPGDARLLYRTKVRFLGDATTSVPARGDHLTWSAPMTGPVRRISLQIAEGYPQPVVVDVPAAQAQQGGFILEFNPEATPEMAFSPSMTVEDGELVWRRADEESEQRFKKAPAK